MPNRSKVYRTQPISCVPLQDEYIATRGGSASCIGTDGIDDRATPVSPSASTAARADVRSAGALMTKEPAGKFHTFGREKRFSAIFIGTPFRLVPKRDHVGRSEVRDRQSRGAPAGDDALQRHGPHGGRRDVEDGLVVDFLHLRLHRQPHGPAAVVVGAQLGVRIVLALEEVLGEAAIRLVALDHVRAGRIRPAAQRELAGGAPDFDLLHPQDVDELRDTRHVALHGNDVAERRVGLSRVNRVLGLLVEVLDHEVREHRRELERAQDAGFHVVRVDAAREVVRCARRNGNSAIPLARLAAAASRRRT